MPTALDILVMLLGGGGIIGAFVTVLKAKPEVSRLVIGAAEGAVLVQGKVIEDLRNDMLRIALDNERCRRRENEMDIQINLLEKRIDDLERRVLDLGGTLT